MKRDVSIFFGILILFVIVISIVRFGGGGITGSGAMKIDDGEEDGFTDSQVRNFYMFAGVFLTGFFLIFLVHRRIKEKISRKKGFGYADESMGKRPFKVEVK